MKIEAALFELVPTHAFGIARGTSTSYHTILLRMEAMGIEAFGEAFPSSRYENTAEENLHILKHYPWRDVDELRDRFQPVIFHRWAQDHSQGAQSLVSGLNSLYWDYFAQRLRIPVAALAGFHGMDVPQSSFTIGIDEPDIIQQKVKEAENYPILKVKLGTDRDKEIMSLIRDITDKPVRVDANEGWSAEEALEKIQWLTTQNVQFVEQPLPAKHFAAMRKLYEQSPLPLFADEDCIIPSDLPEIMECYHGINIKLVKCGGITPATQMIQTARTFGKKIMLGCMVESSAGIAPAAHLAGGADYLDLDGNLLLSNDPLNGPKAESGRFPPLVQPGLNVNQEAEIAWETLFTA